MIDVSDRVPEKPGRVKLESVSGAADTYDMSRADSPTEEGTPVNRALFMSLQGMENCTTSFNSDGSIVSAYPSGTLTTTFNDDGSITETFVGSTGKTIAKTTLFNSDGSIEEVIS